MDVAEYTERWRKVDTQFAIEESLYNKRKDILDKQKEQQQSGISNTGKPFINKNTGTDEYSPGYAKKKGKKKPIDLFRTGSFQNEEFLDVRTDVIVFDSADSKTDKLIKQFGEGIFGLSDESKEEIAPVLQEELIVQLNHQVGK